ncbi:MAG: 3-oxoacyl-[acyl-carrier-protein] reductase [Candidatus Sericytochromatia bacterium]|nr:3-oxoacyl-[acyl-carrier-protein] reductase [Candidatus Tanganyikabacteria bacterium]
MSGRLVGRTALVTGASRGIGRAIAIAMAREGARVGLNFVSNQAAADATCAEIGGMGGEARAFQGDVSATGEADRVMKAFLEWSGGRIDVLVNNAGITRDGLLMRMSDEDWDAVMAVNLRGTFLMARAATRPMIKQRFGRIVNITSVVGLMGNSGQANYAASKAGLVGFTKSLAKELGSRNILVNAVAPGFILSEMTAGLGDALKARYLENLPLGRFGDPEEVAAMVVFLAGEGTYITGQVFNVDGGLHT